MVVVDAARDEGVCAIGLLGPQFGTRVSTVNLDVHSQHAAELYGLEKAARMARNIRWGQVHVYADNSLAIC